MLKDSLKYPLTDIRMIIPLGVVLLATDLVEEHAAEYSSNIFLILLISILALFLAVLEAGYLFKVIEETTNGSTRLPKFTNLWNMLVHGFKEIIVSVLYLSIPLLLILLSVYFLSQKISKSTWDLNLGLGFLIIGMISIFLMTFFLMPIILNMTQHQGSVRSGFNFSQIKNKINSIGIKNFIVPYLAVWIIFGSFLVFFSEHVKAIPIIGIFISQMVITPYLILFTSRILGLIDNKEINH
jgi:hypothetical protein